MIIIALRTHSTIDILKKIVYYNKFGMHGARDMESRSGLSHD